MPILNICELVDVPLISGKYHCKWTLQFNNKVLAKGQTKWYDLLCWMIRSPRRQLCCAPLSNHLVWEFHHRHVSIWALQSFIQDISGTNSNDQLPNLTGRQGDIQTWHSYCSMLRACTEKIHVNRVGSIKDKCHAIGTAISIRANFQIKLCDRSEKSSIDSETPQASAKSRKFDLHAAAMPIVCAHSFCFQ